LVLRITQPRHSLTSRIPTCLASPCTGLRIHQRGLLSRLCRHRLAPVGDPAFRHVCTYRVRLRCPTHPFEPVSLTGTQVAEVATTTHPNGGTTVASLIAMGANKLHSGIRFQPIQASPYRTGLAALAAALSACSGPLYLSVSGKPIDPETSFRVYPRCARDTGVRDTAHAGGWTTANRVTDHVYVPKRLVV
jgi:hypothetical protein